VRTIDKPQQLMIIFAVSAVFLFFVMTKDV